MGQHLTPEQLEFAIDLQRQGKTQQEIADRIGVLQPAISRGLAGHNRRLMKRLVRRTAEQKAKQIQQLESLFSDAVSEWHRSKLDAESTKTTEEETEIGDQKIAAVQVKTETTIKGQTGNPGLLAQARGLLADVRDILGLDAPKATDITSKGERIGGPSFINSIPPGRNPDAETERPLPPVADGPVD